MNCMRYELKNSFFKRCAHIMCNFANICQTLAYRHEQNSLFLKLTNAVVCDVDVVTVALSTGTSFTTRLLISQLECGTSMLCHRSIWLTSATYKEATDVTVS